MLSKVIAFCALVATSQAFHSAISHQSLHKHDGPHHIVPIHHHALHHHIPHHELFHQNQHHIALGGHHGLIGLGHIGHQGEHAWSYPAYKFAYSVHDHHTGDVKSQHESRHGDVVQGGYSLVEPDGNLRNVEYKADDHTGFNAIVHHSSPHHHIHLSHGHHHL